MENAELIVGSIAFALFLVVSMVSIYTVPQGYCVVIERLGKYNRVSRAGLHVRVRGLEKRRHVESWGDVANSRGYLIELTEQQSDTPSRVCHTRDNVEVKADCSVYWRINDPRKAIYNVDVLPRSLTDLALNALRGRVGGLNLDDVLSARADVNEEISKELSKVSNQWGIEIYRAEIQELSVDKATSSAMLRQMESERERRAVLAEASGKAEAQVVLAKANRESMQLQAEADSLYLRALAEVVGTEQASTIYMMSKTIEGLEEVTSNPAHKVFMPNTMRAFLDASGAPMLSQQSQVPTVKS